MVIPILFRWVNGWVPGGGGVTLFTYNIRSLGLFRGFKLLNFSIFIIIFFFFFFIYLFFFCGGGGGSAK